LGGGEYTKYNEVNNNLENFKRGQDCCCGFSPNTPLPPPPLPPAAKFETHAFS